MIVKISNTIMIKKSVASANVPATRLVQSCSA